MYKDYFSRSRIDSRLYGKLATVLSIRRRISLCVRGSSSESYSVRESYSGIIGWISTQKAGRFSRYLLRSVLINSWQPISETLSTPKRATKFGRLSQKVEKWLDSSCVPIFQAMAGQTRLNRESKRQFSASDIIIFLTSDNCMKSCTMLEKKKKNKLYMSYILSYYSDITKRSLNGEHKAEKPSNWKQSSTVFWWGQYFLDGDFLVECSSPIAIM